MIILDKTTKSLFGHWKWFVNSYGYATICTSVNGKKRCVRLHRLVTLAPDGVQVDHINGNRLDNRLSNLRYASQSQNNMNAYKPRGVSGVKGVSWDSRRRKWKASIKFMGVHRTIGRYESIEEAGNEYRKLEVKLFKQFARKRKK